MDEATWEVHGEVKNKSFTLEDYEWGRNMWAVNRWEGDRSRREVEGKITVQLYRNNVSIGMRRYIAIDLEQSSCSNVGRIL